MSLTEKVIWSELKFRILEAAMMLNDDYTNEDVTAKLFEIVELLDNTEPGR